MNNKFIKNNMAKKTVFTGVINGEVFDNVNDYNTKITELVMNDEDILASSSTEIRSVDENEVTSDFVSTCTADQCPGTCTEASTELPEDEDLSFYPYMEDDDPHYLDLLVTDDNDVNQEALQEADAVFTKCYNYITEALEDQDTDQETRREYLEDIRDILTTIKKNIGDTEDALALLDAKRVDIINEFENYKRQYEEALAATDRDVEMLKAANTVNDMFNTFYSAVESVTMTSINDHTPKRQCTCDETCKADCTCDCHKENPIKTTCEEIVPTAVHDFNSLLNRIFGTTGLIRRS